VYGMFARTHCACTRVSAPTRVPGIISRTGCNVNNLYGPGAAAREAVHAYIHTYIHTYIYIYIYICMYIFQCHFNLHTRNILPSHLHPHYSRRNVISSIFCAASRKRVPPPSLSLSLRRRTRYLPLLAFHFNYFRPKVDTDS